MQFSVSASLGGLGQLPSFGGTQPATGGEQPATGGEQPATGGQQPAAGGGGSCDQLERCCANTTISGTPSFQMGCQQIGNYRAIGPQGETTCTSLLSSIRTYFSSVPGTPDLPSECQ